MAAKPRSTAALREAERYGYLEGSPHPWRKQLYLKRRNMTVAHLVYGLRANKLTLVQTLWLPASPLPVRSTRLTTGATHIPAYPVRARPAPPR